MSWRRVVGLTAALVGAACSGGPQADTALLELRAWADGPVRWLMLPAERRALEVVDSPAEAVNFVERFWALRDPEPGVEGNVFRETFAGAVEAADLLYTEPGLRGALTPRGRALVLLGPPAHLQVTTEPALSWTTGRGADRRVTTRDVDLEVWRYPPETLPARYAGALRAAGHDAGVELRFHITARGARLVDGEAFLDLAAKVTLVKD